MLLWSLPVPAVWFTRKVWISARVRSDAKMPLVFLPPRDAVLERAGNLARASVVLARLGDGWQINCTDRRAGQALVGSRPKGGPSRAETRF